ncbi:HEAT repeat domain-containing protein [Balneolales bacterium ANBcel1]|nr:HEAT repeat domain-containing protein [Balneolales bacterium ANBcel1]
MNPSAANATFIDAWAPAVVAAVIVLLAAVFLILILYTTLSRFVMNRKRRRDKQVEEKLQPLIYSCLDGEMSRKEFSSMIRRKHEILAAYKVITLMIENLSGAERQRLQALLELPAFRVYFYRRLRSRRPMDVAQACRYFSRKAVIDKGAVSRLIALQGHPYNVIAYAATLALVNSGDRIVRDKALVRFLHRPRNASMAVHDIIFTYYEKNRDKDEVSEKLVFFVMDSRIPDQTRAAVISMFPTFGFYQWENNLHELLLLVLPGDSNGKLTATLVRVLYELSDGNIEAEIKKLRLRESPFPEVRLEVARIYADATDPESVDILLGMAHDEDLEVRIAAQRALAKREGNNLPDHLFSREILPEWRAMKQSEEVCSDAL